MEENVAKALREPFPPEKIGKRPQLTCRACSDAQSKVCERHRKDRCGECGAWISSAHTHLDFVGHADVTDRLLEVDPEWDWDFLAKDDRGLPIYDEAGGLWITLTVGGKSRKGYGDAQGKKGPNAVKEIIGDAIRNAAMRFGVGLDLWRTETPDTGDEAKPEQRSAPQATSQQRPKAGSDETDWTWVSEFEERVKAAETADSIRGMKREVQAAFKAGKVLPAQANDLLKLCDQQINAMEAA